VGEDVEVRREDQENINKFSRLHQRSAALEEGLKQKQVRPSIFFFLSLLRLFLVGGTKDGKERFGSEKGWSLGLTWFYRRIRRICRRSRMILRSWS
jgi:hypothetical protein